MSLIEAERTDTAPHTGTGPGAPATAPVLERTPVPCRPGQRVRVTAPDGTRFVVRVEEMAATATDGVYSLVASISTPRRHRGHLLTAPVSRVGNELFA